MTSEIKKILVLELWGIGDVVMMSAVIAPLRLRFPAAQIAVLAQEHGREILKRDKDINRVVVFKFPWTAFRSKYKLWQWDWPGLFRVIAELRGEKFDLVLDGRGDPRNDVLSWLIAPRRYVRRHGQRHGSHRIDHWGIVLKELGAEVKDLRSRIVVSAEASAKARAFIEENFQRTGRKIVGIHPGAAQHVRRWPLERFEAVASQLVAGADADVLMFVDPDGYGEDAALRLGLPYFKGPLGELAAVVAQIDHLLCNDTGIMHIADALGVPLTAVFGPGDPGFIGPRGDAEVLIRDCVYRPCFDHCCKTTADCLGPITADEVAESVLRQIRKKRDVSL